MKFFTKMAFILPALVSLVFLAPVSSFALQSECKSIVAPGEFVLRPSHTVTWTNTEEEVYDYAVAITQATYQLPLGTSSARTDFWASSTPQPVGHVLLSSQIGNWEILGDSSMFFIDGVIFPIATPDSCAAIIHNNPSL
jgi:hypothetical protein